MKRIVFAASLTALSLHVSAQTPSLLIPDGTSGIGTNTSNNLIKFNTNLDATGIDWSIYNDARNRFKVNYNSFGNVEIGEVLRIKHNFGTSENYIDIGSQSSDFMHIYSNASFIFNQPIFTTSGVFSGYSNGDLSFQTASATRLTISGTTGNIGIGTASPISNLQIGEGTTNGLVNLGGYANIGSLRSSGDLFIGNRVYAKYNSATENSVIRATQDATLGFSTTHFTELGDIKFYAHTGAITTDTKVNITDYNVFNIMGNGNIYAKDKVGIGTENPTSKLEIKASDNNSSLFSIKDNVGGDILKVRGQDRTMYVRSLEITLLNFPDYVFEKNYSLMPLKEVESYIQANKHLPNIPSAKEIEENGANLGELVKLQMEKIEELTLYMIELQKANEATNKENAEIKKQLEELKMK